MGAYMYRPYPAPYQSRTRTLTLTLTLAERIAVDIVHLNRNP